MRAREKKWMHESKKKYESKIERMRVNNKCVVASLGDWLLLGQEQRAEKKDEKEKEQE